MVSTDNMSTGSTQASRRNNVSVAAAYWWTPALGDPVVTIKPGGDVYGPLDGNRNMSVLIPNRPPPPVICTTLAAASMSSLPDHHTCWYNINNNIISWCISLVRHIILKCDYVWRSYTCKKHCHIINIDMSSTGKLFCFLIDVKCTGCVDL